MDKAIASLLLCGMLVSVGAHADGTRIMHPDWAIILTVTDLATGTQLEQIELDSELRFEDPIECKSIVAKVARVPASDHFAAALKCRKVRIGSGINTVASKGSIYQSSR